MFKILALVGAIAGGATYGLYAHTDLFKCGGGDCPLSVSAETKPCCQTSNEAAPSCCEKISTCSEEASPCCAAKTLAAAGVAPCFASQTIPVSTVKSSCCAAQCEERDNSRAAIGGSAAFVATTLKK
jgi:hypothetical protein